LARIGTVHGGVEIAHGPWDGNIANFRGPPPTRRVTVNLPGTKKLGSGRAAARTVRLTGGPLETFGDGYVTVRYSGQRLWAGLIASVTIKGSSNPLTFGAARLKKAAGVIRIPLSNQAVLIPRGKRLVVTVGDQSAGGVYSGVGRSPVPGATPTIKIGRVTLTLSVLKHTVSR